MNWWHPERFEVRKPYLLERMEMMRSVRRFFEAQDFYEVETPILQVSPCAEAHLHGFRTTLLGTDLQEKSEYYLHTSPEFAMKKLMVAGVEKQFQIAHVFRNGEGSRLHSPEFSMIEWYRVEDTYDVLMDDCVDLLRAIARDLGFTHYRYQDHFCDPFATAQRISVVDVFDHYAGIDLLAHLDDRDSFANVAKAQNVRITETDSWSDVFHAILAEKIEPFLGFDVPTFLYDYPVSEAALSRKKAEDPRLAERFELYICGVELANAFGELTDPIEQRARYEDEMRIKKETYGDDYPIDEEFLAALDYGMPESSGIAVGLDRLAMLAAGTDDIANVLWVPV